MPLFKYRIRGQEQNITVEEALEVTNAILVVSLGDLQVYAHIGENTQEKNLEEIVLIQGVLMQEAVKCA